MIVSKILALSVILLISCSGDTEAQITEADHPDGDPLSQESSENITQIDSDKLNGHLKPETLEILQEESTKQNRIESATYPNVMLEDLNESDSSSIDNQESSDSLSDSLFFSDEISSGDETLAKSLTYGNERPSIINDFGTSGNLEPVNGEYVPKIAVTQRESIFENNGFVNDGQQKENALNKDDENLFTDSENLFSVMDGENDESLFETSDTTDSYQFGLDDITTNLNDFHSNMDAYQKIEEILIKKSSNDTSVLQVEDSQVIDDHLSTTTDLQLLNVEQETITKAAEVNSATIKSEDVAEDEAEDSEHTDLLQKETGIENEILNESGDSSLKTVTEESLTYTTESILEISKLLELPNEEKSYNESEIQPTTISENNSGNLDSGISENLKSNQEEDVVESADEENTKPIDVKETTTVAYVTSMTTLSQDTSNIIQEIFSSNSEEGFNESQAKEDVPLIPYSVIEPVETSNESAVTQKDDNLTDSTNYSSDNLEEDDKSKNDAREMKEPINESQDSLDIDNFDSETSEKEKSIDKEYSLGIVVQENSNRDQEPESNEPTTEESEESVISSNQDVSEITDELSLSSSKDEETFSKSETREDISLIPSEETRSEEICGTACNLETTTNTGNVVTWENASKDDQESGSSDTTIKQSVETSTIINVEENFNEPGIQLLDLLKEDFDKPATQESFINYKETETTTESRENLEDTDKYENILDSSGELTSGEGEVGTSTIHETSTEQFIPYTTELYDLNSDKLLVPSNEEEASIRYQENDSLTEKQEIEMNKLTTIKYDQSNSEENTTVKTENPVFITTTSSSDSEIEESSILPQITTQSFLGINENGDDFNEPQNHVTENQEILFSTTVPSTTTEDLNKDILQQMIDNYASIARILFPNKTSTEVSSELNETDAIEDNFMESTIVTDSTEGVSAIKDNHMTTASTITVDENVDGKTNQYVETTTKEILDLSKDIFENSPNLFIDEFQNVSDSKVQHNSSEFTEVKKEKAIYEDIEENTEEIVKEVDESEEIVLSINDKETENRSNEDVTPRNNIQYVTSTEMLFTVDLLSENLPTDLHMDEKLETTTQSEPVTNVVIDYGKTSHVDVDDSQTISESEETTTEEHKKNKVLNNVHDVFEYYYNNLKEEVTTDYVKREEENLPNEVYGNSPDTDSSTENFGLENSFPSSANKEASIRDILNSLDTILSTVLSNSSDDDEDSEMTESEEDSFEYFEATTKTLVTGNTKEGISLVTDLDEGEKLGSNQDCIPYINTKVFGSLVNMTIKIQVEDSTFYVPSSASLYEDLKKNILNITWRSTNTSDNNSLILMLSEEDVLYILNTVQLFLVHGDVVDVWEKQVIVFEKADYVVEFEDDVKVSITGMEFLRNPRQYRNLLPIEVNYQPSDTGRIHIIIFTGCTVLAATIFATLYVIIWKSRGGTLDIQNASKSDLPA